MSVLLNGGTGTFAAKIDFPAGPWPESVLAADLNGDGKPDLAIADYASPFTVSVLLDTCLP